MSPTTLATIALELNVPQQRVQDLMSMHTSPAVSENAQGQLDDDRAAYVRRQLAGERGRAGQTWLLKPGDTVRRRELHAAYGGQQQGGIITPRALPADILIITDPDAGSRYGYDEFDGLQPDGSFWYTGEGQVGAQQFLRGNRALRDAAVQGKRIRLFRKKGVYATYVGEFTNGEPGYWIDTIPDRHGNPRDGIIFNLVPVEADLDLVAPENAPRGNAVELASWTPPEYSDVVIDGGRLPIESGERVVTRAEFELQSAFGEWLRSAGCSPQRLRIRVGAVTIEPDLYVPACQWIVEAKRSISREHIRMAIGQVLDYVSAARRALTPARPVVLLPSRPEDDLVALLAELKIVLVFRDEDSFTVLGQE